ncbi:MAG: S41 family peptidase [Caulobacteraceae bacterium]
MNDAGGFEIGLSEEAGAPVGARLVGCDGKSAQALFEERVLPYTWNRDIPHKKIGLAPLLLMLDRSDMAARFSTCEIETAQGPQTINLRWRSVSAEQGAELRRSTLGFVVPEQGLRRVGDVWILSLTSFDIQPGAPTEAFRALLEEVRAKAPELRRSTLIVDVRGNHGGNSEWAVNFAKAIWGDAWVDRVTGSFDDSIDWRASADNLKGLEVNLDRNRSQNLSEGFRYWSEARDLMKAAMAKGEPLARQGQPGKPLSKTPPPSLITGKVFFLTDYTCFSSCLLFADIVRRMPGVTHIGLPTDADTAYEDNTAGYLPSGMGALSYSMKVYRHRLRKTNEWYEPQFRWPGGPMTDEAVVKWVGALSKPQ